MEIREKNGFKESPAGDRADYTMQPQCNLNATLD
jgi:hypothetical protein